MGGMGQKMVILAIFSQIWSNLINFGKIGQIGHYRDTFWSILVKNDHFLVNFG